MTSSPPSYVKPLRLGSRSQRSRGYLRDLDTNSVIRPRRQRQSACFLLRASASHFARIPDGTHFAWIFRATRLDECEWWQLWHVFVCVSVLDLKRLLSRDVLSVYEVVWAVHLSETRRASSFPEQPIRVELGAAAADLRSVKTHAL